MTNLIFNQGDQRISVVPIHPDTGAPVLVDGGSDVTVSIVDLRHGDQSSDHTVLASTVVSQDPLSASLTGAAGYSQADPTAIPADASTAALGRTYLLVGTDGTSEALKLANVGASVCHSVTTLRNNYLSGSTLRGVELVATFPSTEADDESNVEANGGPYLVTWTYQVDGRVVVLPSTLWLDRYSLTPPIDDAFVLLAQPDMANRGRNQVSSAILVAWQDFMAECQEHDRDPSMLPAGTAMRVSLRKMALAYLHRWVSGGDAGSALAEDLEKQARAMWDSILVGRAPKGQAELTRDDVGHIAQPKGRRFRLG